jgi:glucose/arabinose dehydrogenase
MTRRSLRSGSALLAVAVVVVAAGCDRPPSSPTTPPASETLPPTTSPGPTATPAPSPTETASPSSALIQPRVGLQTVVGGLDSPVDVAAEAGADGRLFVVEQSGRIRIVRGGALVAQPFLDISDRIAAGGERGLLGLALHPDFPNDPRFFVDYTDKDGDTVVSSFEQSLDADAADPESERVLLTVKQPFANHNGGAVAFGPDGDLYIALGDGGSGGDPQGNGRSLTTHLAKILRIGVDVPTGKTPAYTIPADNPFADGAGGALPEIWLTGLRNPWRMHFDPANGDLWIGDVGQGAWEEIDVARAGIGGLDYGWNTMEGAHCYQPASGCDQTGLSLPVTEYDHSLGCAVIGGVVARGDAQPPFAGWYFFSDSCSGNIWATDPSSDAFRDPILILESGRSISAFGQDAAGNVYLTDLREGSLLELVPQGG